MSAFLECHDVHAYYGAFHALKGVSLSVAAGERVAVFGHNGSGKSTLLKAIVGFRHAVAGKVLFCGEEIMTGAIPRNVQLGMAWVPQTRNVFKDLTVDRNLQIAGLKQSQGNFSAVWEMFPNLRPRRQQLAGALSGGEQQMLALGMALMTKPRLLLLDEPTTGLSPVMAGLVLETVQRMSRELGVALMIVEQNVPRTLAVVDRAIIMKSGRLASDTPAEMLSGRQDLWEWF